MQGLIFIRITFLMISTFRKIIMKQACCNRHRTNARNSHSSILSVSNRWLYGVLNTLSLVTLNIMLILKDSNSSFLSKSFRLCLKARTPCSGELLLVKNVLSLFVPLFTMIVDFIYHSSKIVTFVWSYAISCLSTS